MTDSHWPDSNLIALQGVAERLGVDWRDLLAVMAHESGCLPDPPHRGTARGLIQFEPETLYGLGWTGKPDNFAQLGVAEQLDFVERYFAPYARAGLLAPGLGALYTATFLPAMLHHAGDPDHVLCGQRGPLAWAYTANRAFDMDNKGTITVGDLIYAAKRALAMTPLAQEIAGRIDALEPPSMVVDVCLEPPANDTKGENETG